MRARVVITLLLVGALIMLASAIIFQPSQTDVTVGPHKGTMKKAGNYFIEMKNDYSGFYTFLFNEKIKPVSNKGITGRVKFELGDEASVSFELKPYEQDGFSTDSPVPHEFHSCKVYFNISQRQISAEFENETLIVNENKNSTR